MRHGGRWLGYGLLANLLTACAVTTPNVDPPVTLPATFTAAGKQPLANRWWQDLEDATLNRLMERALSANFSLRSAWSRLRAAQASARRAGAPRLPAVDGTADATRQIDSQRPNSNQHSLGLAASYELDLWGRVRATAKAAALDAQASQRQLQTAAISLTAEVARTWYELVAQRRQAAVLEDQLALNQRVLELVELRFRFGKVGAADVLRQRQLVEQTRGDRTDVRAEIARLEHALAVLVGQSPGQTELPAQTELIDLPPLPQTGLPAELLARRPDVQQAVLTIQAADARVAAAIAERFPRIDLRITRTTSAVNTAGLFTDWLTQLTANLSVPLFDAGRRRAEVERTRAVLAQAINDYGDTVLKALQAVEDGLAQEREQRRKLASLQQQLALADQVVARLRQRYIDGSTTYLDVLDALVNQQQLERQVVTAKRRLITHRITLARALAGGWSLSPPPAPTTATHADKPQTHAHHES